MRQSIIAIYDTDEEYVSAFGELFCRKEPEIQLELFTDWDALKQLCNNNTVDLLLICESELERGKTELKAGSFIALVNTKANRQYDSIFKFQSSEMIIREILGLYSEINLQEQILPDTGKVISGIFSPNKRCGKTIFSLILGQLIAAEQKTLYINFELYNSFSVMTGQEYERDLSDLIYYIKEKKGNWIYYLKSMIYKIGSLDYIPPARYSSHILELSKEEWLDCIHVLCSQAGYEQYILDIDESMRGHLDVLTICDKIYMPVLTDPVSAAKQQSFFDNLDKHGFGKVLDKIEKFTVPAIYTGASSLWSEQLLYGQAAQWVRAILYGEKYE